MNTLGFRLCHLIFAGVQAIALLASSGCAEQPTAHPTPGHADVNGVRLPYVEQGAGPIVLLVHGSVADHRTWDRQRALLARHFRVIAYSQRYFGVEPWKPGWPKMGVPTHTDDLAAFIRSLGVGPVHVVGWSSGASIAINAALRHPGLIKSAFAYEPALVSVVTDSTERETVAADRAAAFGPAVKAARAGDTDRAVREVLDGVENRAGALDAWPPAMQAVALENARTLPLEFFSSEPAPTVTCAQLGQLRPVVAVARGEMTRVSYRLIADAAARCIGGNQHIIVPNGRHLWPADEPQAFSEVVLTFLTRR
ncbi:MAG TPA: alpha/beta hydrolase [Ramlibacter sp.]|nr:alpha/beta hydrolase [Ramlibacter sp.]